MAAALVSTTEKQIVGSLFPDALFFQGQTADGEWITQKAVTITSGNVPAIFQQKKIVVFGVPGAFTPTCSKLHLPGFVSAAAAFKKADIGLYCFSTNSVDVLSAWVKANDSTQTIGWLPDPKGEVTRHFGLGMNSERLGFVSKRFAMLLEADTEGYRVRHIAIEADPSKCGTTSAEALLKLAASVETAAAIAAAK